MQFPVILTTAGWLDRSLRASCVLLFWQAGLSPALAGNPTTPQGYFLMRSTVDSSTISPSSTVDLRSGNMPSSVVLNTSLAGAVLRETWGQINPSPGVYNFDYFTSQLNLLHAYGKTAELEVYAGIATPAWVTNGYTDAHGHSVAGAQSLGITDQNGQTQTMPVPWDGTFQSDWNTFVQAFGAHFNGNSTVASVHIDGPTQGTAEMYLPSNIISQPGYSIASIDQAWNASINSFNTAFPNTTLTLDLSHAVSGVDGVAKSAGDDAVNVIGSRLTIQQDALSAKTSSSSPNPYAIQGLLQDYEKSGVRIGYEMGSASKDSNFGGSFQAAIATAQSTAGQYVAIYTPDDNLSAPYVVPEPSAFVLLELGALFGLIAAARRYRRLSCSVTA